LIAHDGSEYDFGGASYLGGVPMEDVAAAASTPDDGGYWTVDGAGSVDAAGNALFFGSLPGRGIDPPGPIVAIVPTSDGKGYWLFGSDGNVYSFGDAPRLKTGANSFDGDDPITAGAYNPLNRDIWSFGHDGAFQVWTDDHFPGEPNDGSSLPIVGAAAAPGTRGYWVVTADGGVFAYGGAGFFGSVPSLDVPLEALIAGVATTADGGGYWIVGTDGGVFAFGDARDSGSLPSLGIQAESPIKAIVRG
jgi:hypothetical protein